jgi:hypothetical protein
MTTNSKEYMKNYTKLYVSKSPKIICNICGSSYKKVYHHIHIRSNIHNSIDKFKNDFFVLN